MRQDNNMRCFDNENMNLTFSFKIAKRIFAPFPNVKRS